MMTNFSKKIEDHTDSELRILINRETPDFARIASEELTRRTFEQFDKTTTKFSRVLGALAIFQFLIASLQFIFDIQTSNQKIFGFVIFFPILGVMAWMVRSIDKN